MSGWQPIETAPKDGTKIIGGTTFADRKHRGRVIFDVFFECGDWGDYDENMDDKLFRGEHLTHWMPIPTPPE